MDHYWIRRIVCSVACVPFAVIAVAALLAVLASPTPVAAIEPMQQQPGVMDAGDQGGDQQVGHSADIGGDTNAQAEDLDVGQAQGGQANQEDIPYEEPQDLADIPNNEDMYAFDPDSIPDSVFPANADWAFNVPVSVNNLAPQVEKIVITCETLYWHSGGSIKNGRWNHAGQERNKVDCGYAKKYLELENGAFSNNVIIGVQMYPGAAIDISHAYWQAREYECKMYLIGDRPGDPNGWEIPEDSPVVPGWRRADANQNFRWWTERQTIPEAGKPNPPWADDDGSALQDAVNAGMEAAGQDEGEGGEEIPPMQQLPNQIEH